MFAAIAGILLPAIPSLIGLAEGLFSGKQKSGTDKKSMVLGAVREIVNKYAATMGAETQPTDQELSGMIETVFQQLKSKGSITQEKEEQWWLVKGTVTRLRSGDAL